MTDDDDDLQRRQQGLKQSDLNAFSPMTDTEFALWSEQNLPLVRREMRRIWGIEEHAYAQRGSPYGANAADEMSWLFDLLAAYRGQQKDWAVRMTAWTRQVAQDRLNTAPHEVMSMPQPRPLSDFATPRLRATLLPAEPTEDER